ncbi:MAG: DUF934 domain-containing protein [Pseudomonadota bacterium]
MPLLKLTRNRLYPALEEALVEVSLEQWCANPQEHADATALTISNDVSLADLECDVHGFSVIVLDFPAFKDGRAYSQARLLRERYGYAGEIRARGDVLRDQVLFMARCGFDAFEIERDDADGVSAALEEFTFAYQPAADNAEPVWRKRLAQVKAA